MRVAYQRQARLDGQQVEDVKLNLKCRDEIVPILQALQHIYSQSAVRQEVLRLVGKDVNRTTSRWRGRQGLDYWSIVVLAAVRLGCNLNYDKLQDLAEQHRNLRLIMGLGDWQEEVDFDWRRLQDNLSCLRTETLKKLNHLIVAAGHALKPEAVTAVRGDTFVAETNIHYPTDSSLIGDGLRKVVKLAAELAEEHGLTGWRQHQHWLKKVRKQVRVVGQVAQSKGRGAKERLQAAYRELLQQAKELLARGQQVLAAVAKAAGAVELLLDGRPQQLQQFLELTAKVCDNAQRRVLLGETVPNDEKLFSVFETHTELIKRGKQRTPIQFGRNVLVIEDKIGFVCHYQVVAKGVLDQDLVVPVMTKLQKRLGGKIEQASFDRSFHTPANQDKLGRIVKHPCIPMKGAERGRRQQQEGTVEFRQARQRHPGVESAIGALQAGNGLKRCRDRSEPGFERYVGLGILGRNLQVLGKLLLAQDDAECLAARSKRRDTG